MAAAVVLASPSYWAKVSGKFCDSRTTCHWPRKDQGTSTMDGELRRTRSNSTAHTSSHLGSQFVRISAIIHMVPLAYVWVVARGQR